MNIPEENKWLSAVIGKFLHRNEYLKNLTERGFVPTLVRSQINKIRNILLMKLHFFIFSSVFSLHQRGVNFDVPGDYLLTSC